ncbi:hypothetical protein ACO22_02714 [Paracoccidioides brasiliensis]|uniref:Uncharacterized protein n=1 Tax=Paracoccidioides brasiliensis TaxID=121759 RepID=A0A1D2JHX4_PARBR|nr:hypothetical protein ACO22_02714 [Paracoccidioides brasiliensis]
MDSSKKPKAKGDTPEAPRRRLSERRSAGPRINYNVREYYKGINFNDKLKVPRADPHSQPGGISEARSSESSGHIAAPPQPQHSMLTSSTKPPSPELLWDTCLECVEVFSKCSRANKCKVYSAGEKCHSCMERDKMCLKIPRNLIPRVSKLQSITTRIGYLEREDSPWDLLEIKNLKSALGEEHGKFSEDLRKHFENMGTEVLPSSPKSNSVRPNRNVTPTVTTSVHTASPRNGSSIKPDGNAAFSITAGTIKPDPEDSTPTRMDKSGTRAALATHTASVKTLFPKLTSTFPEIANRLFNGDLGADTSYGFSIPKNNNGAEYSRPTSSKEPTATAHSESGYRVAAVQANAASFAAARIPDERTGSSIWASSTNPSAETPDVLPQLLTVLGSIDNNLARIVHAMEVKKNGGRSVRNELYWE